MVVVNCGFPECTYKTPDVGEQLASAALNSHAYAHCATQQISKSKSEIAKKPQYLKSVDQSRIIPKKLVTNNEKCSYCDTSGHGNHAGIGTAKLRKTLRCPAYGKQCHKCTKFNHFSKVCRAQQTAVITEEQGEEHFAGGATVSQD